MLVRFRLLMVPIVVQQLLLTVVIQRIIYQPAHGFHWMRKQPFGHYHRFRQLRPVYIHSFHPIQAIRHIDNTIPRDQIKLYSKKKSNSSGSGGGNNNTASTVKKMQVRMLKTVPGTGQTGDVVLVTPAFFNNKLRPTGSASMISDQEVKEMQMQREIMLHEVIQHARTLQQCIESSGETDNGNNNNNNNFCLRLRQKAGPDGQLFGSIHHKTLLKELKDTIGNDEAAKFLSQKSVKVTEVVDGEGQPLRGDIKHVGSYQATIYLTNDISAKLAIVVEAE